MEENEPTLELYESYPLRHFQYYKKITNSNHYKASSYQHLTTTLTDFVEIIIEFLLLLLQSSSKNYTLAIAMYPGIQFQQNLHFYLIHFKGEKGFIKINHNQYSSQVKKFITSISRISITDFHEQSKSMDFKIIVEWLNNYLQQNLQTQKSSFSKVQMDSSSYIINLLANISKQKVIVKYSLFLQKIKCQLSNKIIENTQISQKYFINDLKNQHFLQTLNDFDDWMHNLNFLNQFFTHMEGQSIIYEFQRSNQMLKIENPEGVDAVNKVDMTKLQFTVHLFQLEQQNQKIYQEKKQRLCTLSQQMHVSLIFKSNQINFYTISTYSLWKIDKKHFVLMETFWLKIQQQWIKILMSLNINSQIITISKVNISINECCHLQFKENFRFSSTETKLSTIVCLIDKQIFLQTILFPYLEAIHRKNNEILKSKTDLLSFSQQKFVYVALVLKKWVKFIFSKFERIKKAQQTY